jgi:probable F420-dependent oxidoreductase
MQVELGKFGAWLNPAHEDEVRLKLAVDAAKHGYGTVWLGGGVTPLGGLRLVEEILAATDGIAVATAIINVWTNDAAVVADSFHRVEAEYPGRVVLGLGIGHPESVKVYQKPYDKLVEYLDQLDGAGVPADRRLLAALGDRVLGLARDRAAGAHPYLVTPEHSRRARKILGPGKTLAVEHKVVLSGDPVFAREVGRSVVSEPYLHLANYVRNLLRLGYTEQDIEGGGSDRLIDALALHGDPFEVKSGLVEHLAAGADHVGIQLLGRDADDVARGYRELSEVL